MSLPFTRLSTSRLALIVSAIVIVVAHSFSAAPPVFAHDQVVSASPGENESLASAPSEVVVEFTADLLDTGALINVTNSSGQDVTSGEVTLDGRTVTKKLQPNLPNGQYQIVWRVVSSDGHPITDKYQFAIGEPVVPVEENTSTSADGTNDSGVTDIAAQPSEPAGETAVGVTSSTQPSSIDWGRIASVSLLGAFAGVVIYAAIFALIRRNNRTNKSQE